MRQLIVLAALCALAGRAETLIQLVDPLDEPELYCVDVPGFRDRLNLDAALMAHTCKPGAADELYMVDHPKPGQIFMKAYDRCVEAASTTDGAEVFMKGCSESKLQRFSFEADGRIKLSDSELCLAVAEGEGTPTGGPSHLRRDLALRPCAAARPELSTWRVR